MQRILLKLYVFQIQFKGWIHIARVRCNLQNKRIQRLQRISVVHARTTAEKGN